MYYYSEKQEIETLSLLLSNEIIIKCFVLYISNGIKFLFFLYRRYQTKEISEQFF